ncbi:5-deoxy-glucuronate isomerase [Micrococcales bacterium 31B]|nr:5-deoxy-glucuronate isomerase [Micrococcales bacterium 31B]
MAHLVVRDGDTTAGPWHLDITPQVAGWTHSTLRILHLAAGETATLDTGESEFMVLALEGSCRATCGGTTHEILGRENVFAGPSDFVYVPRDASVEVTSDAGGRFACVGALARTQREFQYRPASFVPLELRGAGQSTRQVRNFGAAGTFDDCDSLIAVEVITPGGNWSSYPAHKHDEARYETLPDGSTVCRESELEEIYYYEIAPGPQGQPGFGVHFTSSSEKEIDIKAEVRNGDTVLVPHGWHGPCVAAPGHDMYYLNVMAGPDENRSWCISDHPDQAWIRSTWAGQPTDPRLNTH